MKLTKGTAIAVAGYYSSGEMSLVQNKPRNNFMSCKYRIAYPSKASILSAVFSYDGPGIILYNDCRKTVKYSYSSTWWAGRESCRFLWAGSVNIDYILSRTEPVSVYFNFLAVILTFEY